jgi:hypothetical protein
MKISRKINIFHTLTAIIIGISICFLFSFYQDYRKYFATIGFLILIYGTFNFPRLLSIKFNTQNFTKFFTIYFLLTISLIGILFFLWFRYQDSRLENYGQYTKAIVTEKKLVRGEFQITYSYEYRNEKINYQVSNSDLNIGDSILVKFMPDNPYHNEIIEKIIIMVGH